MKKKLVILMCAMLVLTGGCNTNQNENPDNQNQEGTNNGDESSKNDGENTENPDANNENKDGFQGEKQELDPVLTTPTPTEEPTSTPTPTPTEAPTPTPTQAPAYTYTDKKMTLYSIASVHVRDLPDKKGEVVGGLRVGQEVKVTGVCKETGWYRINYGGQDAYVSQKYFTSQKPEEPTPTPTEAPTPTPTQAPVQNSYTYTEKNETMYSKGSVIVRDLPEKKGAIIGGLVKNQEVKVTGVCKETGWYRINYGGKDAYVSNQYLSSNNSGEGQTVSVTPTPTPTPTPTTTVQTYTYKDQSGIMYAKSGVYVRSLPSVDGKTIGSLKKNQEVTITGICNETGWYRIVNNGSVGYVSGGYLLDTVVE